MALNAGLLPVRVFQFSSCSLRQIAAARQADAFSRDDEDTAQFFPYKAGLFAAAQAARRPPPVAYRRRFRLFAAESYFTTAQFSDL